MPAAAILRKTKLLSQNQSLQHAAVLFSGKAGVQLIALLSQPILARLYSPDQFGEFALFNGVLAILLIISCGRYEAAIILARRHQHATRLFQLAQLILIGSSVLLLLVLILIPHHELPQLSKIPAVYIWLLPLVILLSGYWQIVQNWLVRLKRFNQISLISIIQRFLIFGGALVAFYLQAETNGLIIGLVTGTIFIFTIALYHKTQSVKIPLKGLTKYASHFRDFPLYSAPTLLLSLIIFHLPVLWISYFFDNASAGSYSMAFMLVSLPYTSVCITIAPVFYERMARSNNILQTEMLKRVCITYGFVSLLLIGIIYTSGQTLSIWLLGDSWSQTGTILAILSPLILVQGLEAWLMIALTVFRKQQITLFMQVFKLSLMVIALGTSFVNSDLFFSLKLISAGSLLYLGILLFLVLKESKKRNDSYCNSALAYGQMD